MKRFISMILNFSLILSILCSCGVALPPVVATYTIDGYMYKDMKLLPALIEKQKSKMIAAHEMAEAARKLGYKEDHKVINIAKGEWDAANRLQIEYNNAYNILTEKWKQKEEEYPTATYIWTYLKNLGYSDQVCAGILGNIMIEVGGQTLDIHWYLDSEEYYGMCQWAKAYSTLPDGANLEEQCDYLRDTIQNEIDIFGDLYKKGFKYEDFVKLTDISEVALAFATTYERCGSGSYQARQINAINAYNYFVS